jgi:hypothetical protein
LSDKAALRPSFSAVRPSSFLRTSLLTLPDLVDVGGWCACFAACSS